MLLSRLKFWLTIGLLVSNLVVGGLSLYFLHSVGERYSNLLDRSVPALNALRTLPWNHPSEACWNQLYALVRNLGLTSLEEEISAEDVARVAPGEGEAAPEQGALLPLFELPLREARDAFEKLYFEHHLRLEGGNMTRLAERSGLERTHLYRKLKQLDVRLAKRHEE